MPMGRDLPMIAEKGIGLAEDDGASIAYGG